VKGEERGNPPEPCNSHRPFLSIVGQGSECEQAMRDPKGDELLQSTAKPWETAVEAGLYTDVQFVCRSLVWGCKANRIPWLLVSLEVSLRIAEAQVPLQVLFAPPPEGIPREWALQDGGSELPR